ncbi:DUF1772 domain-containing protein [Olivibacter sp. 47]|jgi:uncharacterized membrane protein|uniref:anthrone oxygenase family protein n=1 Tax=Olivibacter sp. 47 TaxID=3056486 RepID=UPI0025A4914C|nr:anthrone oxygenase family protein [Olivibacter sp. 47]MDM8175770.1 DUF1772 domain-containing protein [Olivibacter sp. 47]
MNQLLTLCALLATAIMSGLFFTWSNAIMPGLRRLPAFESLLALQSFNRVILNPWFIIVFLAPLLLLPLKVFFAYRQESQLKIYLLVFATLIYVLGVFIITMSVNVPINEGLNKFHLQQANQQELMNRKEIFQTTWVRFNFVRAVSASLSFLLLSIACVDKE